MKKFKLIIPSFVALIFCMLLIAGSTFALFTSQASASIAVTSGKVQIAATLGEPKLYSADATLTSGDLAGTITESTKTDDNESYANYAGTYYFKQQTGTFANGGTAVVANNTLTLSKMTPGDKAEAGLAIVNSSNVNIKYRLILEAHASGKNDDNVDNADLLSVLKVTFFDKTYIGLSKFVSAWMFREAVETPENLDTGLVIELPLLTDNHYQDLEVSYTITVEAVQGNAKTVDAGLTEYVDKPATQTGTAATTVTQATASAPIELITTTTPLQEGTTIAEFTNAFEVASEGESTVKLDVETAPFEVVSETSYTIVTEEQTPVASVDLNLTVDGETVSTFKAGGSSKITTYILRGLNTVSILYNGDSSKAFGAGQTTSRKATESAVENVGDYFYDSESGKLVFVTDHFSEYVPITNDDILGIIVNKNMVVLDMQYGFDAANNDEIKLLQNVTLSNIVVVRNKLTLDLNGFTITNNVTGNQYVQYTDEDQNTSEAYGRAFVLTDNSSLIINANGGSMVIPESNNNSYGFFRVYTAELTINGGTYTGDTNNGAFIHAKKYYGGTINLNNVTGSTNYRFVASDGYVWGELNVNGGTYTQDNTGLTSVGGTIPAFYLAGLDITFDGVKITSDIGACVEVEGYKGNTTARFKGENDFKVLTSNMIQEWNATAIGVGSNAEVIIDEGRYSGAYGLNIFSSGGDITINDGIFIGTSYAVLSQFDYPSYGQYGWSAKLTINNGRFDGNIGALGQNASLTVKAGMFTVDPTQYVVENQDILQYSDNTYGVGKNLEIVEEGNTMTFKVYSEAALKKLNDLLKTPISKKILTIEIMDDINAGHFNWVMVEAHQDFGNLIKEINGNNHVIYKFNINGQAMFSRFATGQHVLIRNIEFDKAKVISSGLNTSLFTIQSYDNLTLDNVTVKNSYFKGAYKVAPLVATVYNENPSTTITCTLNNCTVENCIVETTSYDYFTTGMVSFVYAEDNDQIVFTGKNYVKDVKLIRPAGDKWYYLHATIYAMDSSSLVNTASNVFVSNVQVYNSNGDFVETLAQ